MKKAVCAALAVVTFMICLSLISCLKPTVVGKWEMKVDGGTFVLKGADGSDDPRFSGEITTYVTFGEDGTVSVKADADSVAEFLRNNLTAFIENATKNSGRQMTLEEYMEVAGVANEDALVALFVPEIAEYEIISEYSYEDGILTLRERGEEFKIDVSLTSKTLVLKGMIEDGESAGIIRKSDMPNNLKRLG